MCVCVCTRSSKSLFVSRYKSDVDGLMKACFGDYSTPTCLKDYMKYVYQLSYEQVPDYEVLRGLFHKELKYQGMKDDGKNLDWLAVRKVGHVSLEDSFSIAYCNVVYTCSARQWRMMMVLLPERERNLPQPSQS